MPRYDFSCFMDHVFEVFLPQAHGLDLGEHQVACRECGAPAKWKPSVQVEPEFKPFYHEHLDSAPVLISSREQYRAELVKRDMYGPAGYNERSSKSAKLMKEMHEERKHNAQRS